MISTAMLSLLPMSLCVPVIRMKLLSLERSNIEMNALKLAAKAPSPSLAQREGVPPSSFFPIVSVAVLLEASSSFLHSREPLQPVQTGFHVDV